MTLQDCFLENPRLQSAWASSRNAENPRDLLPGSHRKVWWQCQRGHAWQAPVYSVSIDGCFCPYCAGLKAIPGETDLATMRPDVMQQWDYEKNMTVDPSRLLPSSHEKVWWKCALGHSWQAMIFSRTKENPAGCPYCAGRKVLPGFNDLATLRPKLARQWHSQLNGALRPEDVTLGSNQRAWWQCADGHVWQAAIYSRTRANGSGCPLCAKGIPAP